MDPQSITKRCTRCNREKPLTEFGLNPVSLDGRWKKCQVCIRYRRVPDEEYFANIDSGKHYCFKCKTWKLPSEFVKSTERFEGLACRCILCHREVTKDYAKRTRPKQVASSTKWRKDNRERHLAARKAYRDRNGNRERARFHRYYAQNIEAMRERSRIYSKNNPDKVNAQHHRRRARVKGNGGNYTAQEWQALCAYYDNRCLKCGEQKPLTVDHVVPIIKGGMNDILNLQPLCRQCNTSKHDKIIDYRKKGDMKKIFNQATLFDGEV